MKLLLISDTHRELISARKAIERERPDAVLHLGDHAQDAFELSREFYSTPISYVRGNCDGPFPDCSETYLRTLAGVRIFAVHGHRHGVKGGTMRLWYAAQEQKARIAAFGHTHAPCCCEEAGLWLVNPGACRGFGATYAVVTLNNGDISDCVVKEVYREETL